MGSIYWQMNDCWPVASWSSLDYYGRWKALQYYARRFYSPVLVSPHQENGGVNVYIANDQPNPASGELWLRVMSFDGKVLVENKQNVNVAPTSSAVYMQLPIEEALTAKGIDPATVFVTTEFSSGGKSISSNLIYLTPTVQIHLPPAPLKTELAKTADGYQLRVTSPVLARSVYANIGGIDADYSDNYFNVLPGQTVEIAIRTNAPEDKVRSGLKVISLVDAFDPNAANKPSPAAETTPAQ
jgi:beta-mannosidase